MFNYLEALPIQSAVLPRISQQQILSLASHFFSVNIFSMNHLRLTKQPRLRPSKTYHSFVITS